MVKHGSRVIERGTSLTTPVVATSTLLVVFGTAPVNLAENLQNVNKPVLASSFEEYAKALGYSNDWENYTLCEVADAAFRQFSISPIVFVNVLDPTVHKASGTATATVINKKAVITTKGILLDTLALKNGSTDLVKDTDYIASFDDEGNVAVALLTSTSITTLNATFQRIAPEEVDYEDVIGGVNVESGKSTGLELLNSVFPMYGLIPGLVIAPKFSKNPTVASVMKAKASSINSYFRAESLNDVDTQTANNYSKVVNWKNQNNYTSADEIVCWPKVGLGDNVYHLSTQIACRIVSTAYDNDDYPYESPSNKALQITKLLVETANGHEEIELGPDQAEYLNMNGITTALNFIGGWKAWGNYTGAYPSSTEVKDIFIPVRLTHNWIANTIILTTWDSVDGPISRRLIDSIVDTMNMWMNALTSQEVLLGGRVEFREEDNSTSDLVSGKVRFRYFVAEPVPAQDIENILEFDATYYSTLFE